MANKTARPERAGAGSSSHPTKIYGVPAFRRPKLRSGGTGVNNLSAPVAGQIWPRRN